MRKHLRKSLAALVLIWGSLSSSHVFGSDEVQQCKDLMARFSDCEEAMREVIKTRSYMRPGSEAITPQDNVILLVGPTGTGKSTLLHLIAKKRVYEREIDVPNRRLGGTQKKLVWDVNPADLIKGSELGHAAGLAGTFIPSPYVTEDMIIWDLPGLNDVGGPVVDLTNAYLLKRIVDSNEGRVRVLVTLPYDVFTTAVDRGKPALKVVNKIAASFGWGADDYADRFGVVITRCPSSQEAGYNAITPVYDAFLERTEWGGEDFSAGVKLFAAVYGRRVPVFSVSGRERSATNIVTFPDHPRLLDWIKRPRSVAASLTYTPRFSAEETNIMNVMKRELSDVKDDLGNLLTMIQEQYAQFSFIGQFWAGWQAHFLQESFETAIDRGFKAFKEGKVERPFSEYMDQLSIILEEKFNQIFGTDSPRRRIFDRTISSISDRDDAHAFLMLLGAGEVIYDANLPKIFKAFGNAAIDLIENIRNKYSIRSIFNQSNIRDINSIVYEYRSIVRNMGSNYRKFRK